MMYSITFVSMVLIHAAWMSTCLARPKPNTNKGDMHKAMNYLMNYGYLKNDGRAGRLRTASEIKRSVKLFQSMTGLDMTGELDNKTMTMIQSPRCGMSDFGKMSGTRRKRRYAIQGSSWEKKHLTYMYPDKGPQKSITMDQVKKEMNRAFQEWQDQANLFFTETTDPKADIIVRFASGYHDDGYPFDGEGGTLAHGFYPITDTGSDGDVHFDDDENWILDDKGEPGTDFYWTALHEIGHALGLDHSTYKESIMFPIYPGYRKGSKLSEDDKEGIRYLYGMPNLTINTASPPTMVQRVMHTIYRIESPCDKTFDAVFTDQNRLTYFMSGKYYWEVTEQAQRIGPYQIADKWKHAPADGVDAAYQSKGFTTFFKGNKCWVYNGTKYWKGPENISTIFVGINSSVESIDAAFVWGANGKTYLFKGNQYWRYNEALNAMDMGYPVYINQSWSGVPSNLNSAMTWINGQTYFFKGNDFWLFNNHEFRVEDTKPLQTNMYWMKCSEYDLNSHAVTNTQHISALLITLCSLVLFNSVIV